ncbi:MAG: hypothetical protein JWN78_3267 [Bacteroidota bacterium]|nr:hypothetical protein [Bacteroidota bacterium]
MERQLVITEDGSSSVFIAELSEHYHSIHGALQESQHVFIDAGLHYKTGKQTEINILEVGFGTGLNALLTCMEVEKNLLRITYTAVEKFPLDDVIYPQLNYCSLLNISGCDHLYKKIYLSPWQETVHLTNHFSLLKLKMDVKEISFANQFDIIYFDAFAPTAQPELWTAEIFNSMYNSLMQEGILVTYCAKGEVKRIMRSAGFKIEALPGAKGKREMTRGIK